MSDLSDLKRQVSITRFHLRPDALKWEGCIQVTKLIADLVNFIEENMDKKMAKVTRQMKTAGRDIKKKQPKAALKVLKKAEKKNVKLTKIDREVRDPIMKKYAKMKKKGCK